MRYVAEEASGVVDAPPIERGAARRLSASVAELALVAIVTLAAIWIVPVAGVTVHDNGAMYLQQAAAIVRGDDPGLTFEGRSARGPVFPALLSLALAIDRSVFSAMVVVRIFLALGIVFVYVLGRRMYDRRTGVLCAALAWSSYGVNVIAGLLDTDIVLPVVLLMFLLTYVEMLRRSSVLLAMVAGVLLGVAALVKESAVVFVALPAAGLLFGADSSTGRVRRCAFVYGACAAVILPWAISVTIRYGTPWVATGVMNPSIQVNLARANGFDSAGAYWIHQLTLGAPVSLVHYFQQQLSRVTPLVPLIALSWIVVAVAAIRRRSTSDVVLILSGLVFLPVILPDGALPGRVGQTSIFFFLSYLALAAVAVRAIDLVFTNTAGRVRQLAVSAASIGIVALSTTVQLRAATSDGASTLQLWREGHGGAHALGAFGRTGFRVAGRFTEDQQAAAAWLRDRDMRRVVADGYSGEALAFFLDTGRLELLHPLTSIALWRDPPVQRGALTERPIFLVSYSGFRRGTAWLDLYAVSQEAILEQLEKNRAEYVVLSGRGQFLSSYFDSAPWAERVFRQSSVFIYRIVRNDALPAPFDFSPGLPVLHYRTGDGTRGHVALSGEYTRFEVPGQLAREPDNIFFYLDRPGVVMLDSVEFGPVRADRSLQNLLGPGDSDFESPEYHWTGTGTHQLERVADHAYAGRHALKITALEPGGSTSLVSLTTPNYAYRGGANVMTFHARVERAPSPVCVNEGLRDDIAWLETEHPEPYRRLEAALTAMTLTVESVRSAECVVPDAYSP